MAEIVNSLFGLSPAQIRQQEDLANQAFGVQIANTFVDPWERQQAAQGAMIGNAIAKLGGKLFGLESPELKRATTLESILQETSQQVGSQDPAVLYPVLAKRLSESGFAREALQVGAIGEKAKREALKESSDIMYKDSMTKYYGVLQANQEAALEAKKIEQQGQVAFGGLQAYKGIADPVGKTRVWNSTLDALAKKGVDVEAIRDIPWEQREATLNSIVESSDTTATRTKEEIVAMQIRFKEAQQAENAQIKRESNDLKAAIANLNLQIAQMRTGSAEKIAAQRQVNSLEDKLLLLNIKEANDTNAGFASAIGTKEFNKQITGYLKEDVGLEDPNEIKSALTEFNTLYSNYLGQKNEQGFPKYNNVQALNLAKKDIESKVETVTKTFAGVGVGSRTKFSGKATKDDPLNLRKK